MSQDDFFYAELVLSMWYRQRAILTLLQEKGTLEKGELSDELDQQLQILERVIQEKIANQG